MDLAEGVRGADLVILCGPVSVIVSQLKAISKRLSPHAIVIDVGSSKRLIETTAKRHLNRGVFVGCHPMAGDEKKGVCFAKADLFEGAVCFVTRRHPKVERFWKRIGCHTVLISAKKHDQWAAWASHLPHVLSFALFGSVGRGDPPGRPYGVNPSLRDLARISKSDPKLWADILLSNAAEVSNAITRFEDNLRDLKTALRSRRASRLATLIARANRISHRVA
ncbi:MAG: hypothetical protein A3D28_04175 [Omnitrophica bacterium RIFCSPHIGHO2_02_FULL_63_14]|nr:MAG: hypothetical protein A3D28_04175 [Omnitrophica bacterium RIFCSPHIGHO2_02_FULL_63_14]